MKSAVVLGCGLVGATISRDLAEDGQLEVTGADIDARRLKELEADKRVRTLRADLSSPQKLRELMKDFDVVVGALPSRLGRMALEAVIEVGRPYCDISFMAEDALELDERARERGVTAVVDCGVAPGLANLAIGHSRALLDELSRVVYYVGGLPKARRWPYAYKAPYAPADVLEVYTRPARMRENGRLVVKPALSEQELIDFPLVGTLEGFNTDGLRSLLQTVQVPNMKEKTLRYPGHAELMRVFAKTGLFSHEPLQVEGVQVSPMAVTSQLLFKQWALGPDELEFTVLRVEVEGTTGDKRERHTYELYDEYDVPTKTSSMARTTGFPCSIVTKLLVSGEVSQPGVLPPELLACPEGKVFDHMREELARRGIELHSHFEILF